MAVIPKQDPTSERLIRQFNTGATRDTDEGKFDYEGFLSPAVLERFAEYMHKHRKQSDGSLRASDNWQKGIPKKEYMKSAFRHFFDWWKLHRGYPTTRREKGKVIVVTIEEAICGLIFNSMGYLHEFLKAGLEGRSHLEESEVGCVDSRTSEND